MKPVFFANALAFRKWLEKNYKKEKELWVGYYKKHTGKSNMTWSESVDQALCFGWIDGIRKGIDEESYCNRFTPRKPKSNWSEINIKKVKQLIKDGLMHPAGLELYKNRKKKDAGAHSYENKPTKLPPALEKKFKSDKTSWKFFQSQSPSYQKTMFFWILSAKKEETQVMRLEKLIKANKEGKK